MSSKKIKIWCARISKEIWDKLNDDQLNDIGDYLDYEFAWVLKRVMERKEYKKVPEKTENYDELKLARLTRWAKGGK